MLQNPKESPNKPEVTSQEAKTIQKTLQVTVTRHTLKIGAVERLELGICSKYEDHKLVLFKSEENNQWHSKNFTLLTQVLLLGFIPLALKDSPMFYFILSEAEKAISIDDGKCKKKTNQKAIVLEEQICVRERMIYPLSK